MQQNTNTAIESSSAAGTNNDSKNKPQGDTTVKTSAHYSSMSPTPTPSSLRRTPSAGSSVDTTENCSQDGRPLSHNHLFHGGEDKKSSRTMSSFLSRMEESFKRSGGTRGAGMEILRGSKGSDFEGRALVKSAGSETSCGPLRWLTGCFGRGAHNGRDEHKEEKHLLVKGLYCFVFYKIDDLAPRYAISLSSLKAVVTDSKPGLTVVTLETKQGDVGYELWFEDMLHAKKFRDVVAEKARISKLHHAHPPMLKSNSSIRISETVGKMKLHRRS